MLPPANNTANWCGCFLWTSRGLPSYSRRFQRREECSFPDGKSWDQRTFFSPTSSSVPSSGSTFLCGERPMIQTSFQKHNFEASKIFPACMIWQSHIWFFQLHHISFYHTVHFFIQTLDTEELQILLLGLKYYAPHIVHWMRYPPILQGKYHTPREPRCSKIEPCVTTTKAALISCEPWTCKLYTLRISGLQFGTTRIT